MADKPLTQSSNGLLPCVDDKILLQITTSQCFTRPHFLRAVMYCSKVIVFSVMQLDRYQLTSKGSLIPKATDLTILASAIFLCTKYWRIQPISNSLRQNFAKAQCGRLSAVNLYHWARTVVVVTEVKLGAITESSDDEEEEEDGVGE